MRLVRKFLFVPILLGLPFVPGGNSQLDRFAVALCLGLLSGHFLLFLKRRQTGE